MDLNLVILTPGGVAFEGPCSEAYFPSSKGPLGILPGYTSIVAELANTGVIKITVIDKTRFFSVWHGVLEVKPDKIVCLTENAIEAASEEEALELIKGVSFHLDKNEKDVLIASAILKS